ncbi:Mus7/MMS22 family-domain-containing protein [Mycena floridula]|nr:Mus7/MMS22 family-domain-containing protein [Mycena floridula]
MKPLLEIAQGDDDDDEAVRPTLDGASLEERTAEVWIFLIHVLDSCGTMDPKKPHPFWQFVFPMISAGTFWETIFHLCAISQFSVHGFTRATSTLPTCWSLIETALKDDQDLFLITHQCLCLRDRWKWELFGKEGWSLMRTLNSRFKANDLANLDGEDCKFPKFMHDGSQLGICDPADTAFAIFMNLSVHYPYDAPSLAKLCSNIIPDKSLEFPKDISPSSADISKLINRYSAMFVVLHLDKGDLWEWFKRARKCVDFKESDEDVRNVIIRAWGFIAASIAQRKLTLKGTIAWAQDILDVLVDEYVANPNSEHFNLKAMLSGVQSIIEERQSECPNAAFVNTLGRWFKQLENQRPLRLRVIWILKSCLEARVAANPPIWPPIPVALPDPESQDEFSDFDLNLASLCNDPELSLLEVDGQTIYPTILGLREPIYQLLLDEDLTDERSFAALVETWFRSVHLTFKTTEDPEETWWSTCLDWFAEPMDRYKRRRLEIPAFLCMLELDPKLYLDEKLKKKFFNTFWSALAAPWVINEHRYVARFIHIVDSLDLPLLRGIPCKEIDHDDFLTLRLDFLKIIFDNLENILTQPDNTTSGECVEELINFFVAIRMIDKHLNSTETCYKGFRTQVAKIFQSHQHVWAHPRLNFWRSIFTPLLVSA